MTLKPTGTLSDFIAKNPIIAVIIISVAVWFLQGQLNGSIKTKSDSEVETIKTMENFRNTLSTLAENDAKFLIELEKLNQKTNDRFTKSDWQLERRLLLETFNRDLIAAQNKWYEQESKRWSELLDKQDLRWTELILTLSK